MFKKLKKYRFLVISLIFTLLFAILSFTVFSNAFVRISESFTDLWNSIKYYFNEIFLTGNTCDVTVNNLSSIPFSGIFGLPATWEEFQIAWSRYWAIFASGSNLSLYFNNLSDILYEFSKFLLLFGVPVILFLVIMLKRYLSKTNNDYDKTSKPLKIYKYTELKILYPIKSFISSFILYLKQHDKFVKLWLTIWAFNFNFFAIFIEFLAFYFYFVISFDFRSIYIQIIKLIIDLSVCLSFIPGFVWLILGIVLVIRICKKIGYKRLNHFENRNCGFINERPIVTMVCGTMGKKKTTLITDMALSQEKMFRDKAFELLFDNDMKFPNFPWINLENNIKWAIKEHLIYNLASCKNYSNYIKKCFIQYEKSSNGIQKSIKKHLKKHYRMKYKNILFGYDYERYGLYYNDKLKVIDIFDVIQNYSQLYFVYIIQSSLMLTNYSIRTDNLLSDLNNFPLWDTDFFFRNSKDIDFISRHSHIIDFDALRLGNKVIEDNYKQDSFDFGVINITEIGKERKNTLELREVKKNNEVTNQKNDGFNDWLKMVRHSSTIDNFPFVKVFTDEQRPESWGADAKDLCEIVHIAECGERKIACPLFFLVDILNDFVINRFNKFYYNYRFRRSDNSLFLYLYKKVAYVISSTYRKIVNTFGYFVSDLQVEAGTQDGLLSDKKYYLMFKKIYSKRFSTDCFSDFFNEKNLKSPIGIDDLEEYQTEKATFEELQKQNSYFINDLINKK